MFSSSRGTLFWGTLDICTTFCRNPSLQLQRQTGDEDLSAPEETSKNPYHCDDSDSSSGNHDWSKCWASPSKTCFDISVWAKMDRETMLLTWSKLKHVNCFYILKLFSLFSTRSNTPAPGSGICSDLDSWIAEWAIESTCFLLWLYVFMIFWTSFLTRSA